VVFFVVFLTAFLAAFFIAIVNNHLLSMFANLKGARKRVNEFILVGFAFFAILDGIHCQ
jgi:hypothetical protein